MKKVSYRSQKVGESENATNILPKLKAYLSLQSLPLGNKTPCFSRATLQAMKERQLRRSPQKAGSFVTCYTRGNEGDP